MPYSVGTDETTLCFTELKAMQLKYKNFPLLLETLFVLQKTKSESWALPLTTWDYLGLSSHNFVENSGRVCKCKAIYLGFCFTLHIWNTNRTIHDTVSRGLKRQLQTTAFLSHQTPSFLCCTASETHTFSLHMNATHAPQLLEENKNQKVWHL